MTEGGERLIGGRYRLRRLLGRGGMGVVWLAHDEFLHRDVAIKEIQPRGREIRPDDPEVLRTFREARAAAKLSGHAGIVTVHDVATDEGGLPWIVMELLSGHTLAEALEADGPMSADRTARIALQVVEALDHAHVNGVLHRDVKPGNVMLVGDKAVLTDFGIALLDGASVITATGQVPGAPEYIAPERILGEEAKPAADLWSVGVMIYRMTVGRTPFQRPDIQSTLAAALSQEPDPHTAIGPLWPVVQGLLRKKPAERWSGHRAVEKLAELSARPARLPEGTRLRVEYPTRPDNPAGAVTVVDETTPATRTLPPPLPPPVTRAAPGDVTVDVTPRRARSAHRAPLIAVGVLLLVAAVVVAVSRSVGDRGDAASTTTDAPPDAGAQVPLKMYQERELAFQIGVPEDWERDGATTGGPLGSVGWERVRSDPGDGALSVRVQRDSTKPGVSAVAYLTDEAKSRRTSRDYAEFDQLGLRDAGASADLEYTQRAAVGPTRRHTRVSAYPRGAVVYTVTFSLADDDEDGVRRTWAAAQPLVSRIRDSFQFTP